MIVSIALRIAASRALANATIAETRVHDSAIASIDDLMGTDPKPFIVVSTDDQVYSTTGLDVLTGTRSIDLVIDVAVGSATVVGEGEGIVTVPHTDAGTELSVNFISRQVLHALFEPNSGGAWGLMFRKIASKVSRLVVRRGAGSQKGIKFAAAQLVFTLDPLAEPPFGRAPEYVWAEFLALVRGDPKVAPLADGIEKVIVGQQVPDWASLASAIGISNRDADAIGIWPVIVPTEAPAGAAVADVEGIGLVTEADIEDQLP